jgi:ketosteroid isomerase-like protein
MPHANVELVQRVYGAYMQDDRDAVRAAFDPGIRWHNSGYDPTAGTLEGPDAVLAYLMGENHMEDYRLEVIDMLASDERVAVVAKTSGRIGDQALVNQFVQLLHLRDGRVVEVWNYNWDQRGLAEAFAAVAAVA